MDCIQKSTFDKLRVAFNNAYRRVLNLPWRCSASAMYANFRIQNFEAVTIKPTYGFIQRLNKSTNFLVMAVEKLWIVRITQSEPEFLTKKHCTCTCSRTMKSRQIIYNGIIIILY